MEDVYVKMGEVTTKFFIKKQTTGPITGDDSNIGLYVMIMLMASLAGSYVFYKKRELFFSK